MKARIFISAAMLVLALGVAQGAKTYWYSWEDGENTILGSYGNVGSASVVSAPDPVLFGNNALKLVEDPLDGTPQAYVAFIENLADGDMVSASFWAYDDTPSAAPSARIWGHYATSGDVNSYNGSAGGNGTYSGTEGQPQMDDWFQVGYDWTFDSDGGARDALVIEVRLYSGDETQNTYFIDGLSLEAPDTATVMAPVQLVPEPGSIGLLLIGLAGAALMRLRRKA